jgi:hypothetical protein
MVSGDLVPLGFSNDEAAERARTPLHITLLLANVYQPALRNNMRNSRAVYLPAPNILMDRIVIVAVGTILEDLSASRSSEPSIPAKPTITDAIAPSCR